MNIDYASLREQYGNTPLEIEDLGNDPFLAFGKWFAQALTDKVKEPNALTLATVDQQGRADARVVLLKEQKEDFFVFYTNYASSKGQQIQDNNSVAMVFNWLDQERQIRIRGHAHKYDETESIKYFQSRPRGSQVAAWSSPQSKAINDRQVIEQLVEETETMFKDESVLPLPPTWGGYKVLPYEIEFWQGRKSRLHDRIKFTLDDDGKWIITRLAP